ncbi:anti-sigma-28 factor, FlgM family [Lachnospiraceae bacterium YSD2013]|jgi:negative regulator of flagellin synthesis FlgM|nr:flagellar biosynthesis anti-sigma factor FlgM [Lachnospiraceae bacterium]MBO4825577.1 flagellar biosynthesis anti-sigma factor FlgM [Lachnospiraceae bacterium]MBR5760944.1 flagellar biosynthesis anti-sigma factor FlgM [Lachnospiraceae bacterium]MBR5992441.1 flagellar biosynthesis anti-sigma factor FlgM [Lachnospiraceae bacterium]SCX16018.1 anti-sigma-28 factor, FlgM family [Lachnospiraceae bacterium YSD2013]
MRIEAYTQVQQLYNSAKVQKDANVAKKGQTDQVQISSMGLNIQAAKAAVKSAEDIRFDKVNPIKEAIANGTYNVSAESFADKLLEKYESLR